MKKDNIRRAGQIFIITFVWPCRKWLTHMKCHELFFLLLNIHKTIKETILVMIKLFCINITTKTINKITLPCNFSWKTKKNFIFSTSRTIISKGLVNKSYEFNYVSTVQWNSLSAFYNVVLFQIADHMSLSNDFRENCVDGEASK